MRFNLQALMSLAVTIQEVEEMKVFQTKAQAEQVAEIFTSNLKVFFFI